jgi:hypothetical protein
MAACIFGHLNEIKLFDTAPSNFSAGRRAAEMQEMAL